MAHRREVLERFATATHAPPLASSLQDQGPRFGGKADARVSRRVPRALCKFRIEKDVERSDLAIANNDNIQSGVVWGLAFRA
jgi:hypothetical protein